MSKYENYIMFRKKLENDPRVLKMSEELGTHVNMVLGALARLWFLADDFADETGRFQYTKDWINKRVDLPGFADALPEDWLQVKRGVLYLPNYQALNTKSTKARFEDTKRKREERLSEETRTTTGQKRAKGKERKELTKVSSLKEKKSGNHGRLSTADILTQLAFPEGFDTVAVRAALSEWLTYKEGRGEGYKAPVMQLGKMLRLPYMTSPEVFVQRLDQAIAGDWKGPGNYDSTKPKGGSHGNVGRECGFR